jgi:hypothetical protein
LRKIFRVFDKFFRAPRQTFTATVVIICRKQTAREAAAPAEPVEPVYDSGAPRAVLGAGFSAGDTISAVCLRASTGKIFKKGKHTPV